MHELMFSPGSFCASGENTYAAHARVDGEAWSPNLTTQQPAAAAVQAEPHLNDRKHQSQVK